MWLNTIGIVVLEKIFHTWRDGGGAFKARSFESWARSCLSSCFGFNLIWQRVHSNGGTCKWRSCRPKISHINLTAHANDTWTAVFSRGQAWQGFNTLVVATSCEPLSYWSQMWLVVNQVFSFFFLLLFPDIVRKWPASCWLLQANNITADVSTDNIVVNQLEAVDRVPSTNFLESQINCTYNKAVIIITNL